MNLSQLLSQIAADGSAVIPETWLQGRTAYGGLSTALAHAAAKQSVDGIPPLRSAQVSFVGPLAGKAEVRTELLRRGKNSAYVAADLFGEDGMTMRGNFIYAAHRQSDIGIKETIEPDWPELPTGAGEHHPRSPAFFRNHIELGSADLRAAIKRGRITTWLRFSEREGLDPESEILAIGDALPPAMMGSLPPTAMISSMNWQINITATDLSTQDGWWLLDSRAQHAGDGASSQLMMIWNSRRELVATGMQAVAYYA